MGYLLKKALLLQGETFTNSYAMSNGGVGFSTSAGACSSSTGGPTLYSAAYFGVGTYIFVDTELNGTFYGNSLWYRLVSATLGQTIVVQINNSGQVIATASCP